ncbi:hypothetical protein GLX27_004119 [Malassezia furfur]|uniref:Uncharacterized protein n=1 Tax=Malassezia furfur TaxID=55194 RepID=A0ABY8EV13_MALFU|nr:hypothetical protein GLX27_004119 [Malassezia furfur]
MDREEFFRLKKVQGKKKREAAQEAAKEGQPKTVDDTDAAEVVEPPAGADGPGDLVSGDKDTDVIF